MDEPVPGTPDAAPLTNEAMTKSGLLWVRVPQDGTTHPVWHVWEAATDDTPAHALVVSGPGEQRLPRLPDEVEVVLRSKDTGGRLLTVRASAHTLTAGTPEWDAAVAALRPERLNATGDVDARWRDHNTIHVLVPHGTPLEAPGSYDDGSGAAPVAPAGPTTVGARPWHLRGRAGAWRNTRRGGRGPTAREG